MFDSIRLSKWGRIARAFRPMDSTPEPALPQVMLNELRQCLLVSLGGLLQAQMSYL